MAVEPIVNRPITCVDGQNLVHDRESLSVTHQFSVSWYVTGTDPLESQSKRG
jgi:hypothetical protein